ncbi:hypothetical protein KXJ69_04830 [Aureisphaera sp. CAU 1614]|uniref:HTH luxR-type domain-containing protein n=1 Tax=Halomarinibacterium sedimenti TaxID=2857106 RepID=A0A9X1FN01_9FLAO|nr:tetratricopeptide repeat protein [Halomarinibacterium sedimenti]MBW2937417.1 hypothetical protein [Halomarinibacterium sedimenti]
MCKHACVVVFLFFSTYTFQLFAQSQWDTESATQSSVIDRINLGINYLSKKEYAKSIEELVYAREISIQNSWYPQVFNATLNIGTNYFLMMDYGEAFHYYLLAYETALAHLGPKQEMQVFNNVGVLYIEDKDFYKAKESFLNAYEIAAQLGDKEQMGAYAINLALVGNELGELEFSERYINEALPLLEESPNVFLLGQIAKAENLLLKGDLLSAEKLALSILPQMENLSHLKERITVNDKISVLIILARVYEKLNRPEKALEFALLARSAEKNIEARIKIYTLLSQLYSQSNDYEKAVSYKDSVIIATDSLYAIKNGMLFKSEQLKFQVQNYKKELIESKDLLKQERQFYYVLIICVVVFMGFLVLFFKNTSLKHKQRKKIVELELEREKNETLLNAQKHQEKEALVLLERERLKNELDVKNRELTAKALYLSSKNELIEEIVESISKNTQIENNALLKKQINDLKKHLKKDRQWDSFFIHFEEVNQGFLNKLRAQHPELTPGDIRFITFLYMNLSYKEIASLLNITPQSCRKRKERISKKMNLSSNTSLHVYLANI